MPRYASRLYLRSADAGLCREVHFADAALTEDGALLAEASLAPEALKAQIEALIALYGDRIRIAADSAALKGEPALWCFTWDGEALGNLLLTGPAAEAQRQAPVCRLLEAPGCSDPLPEEGFDCPPCDEP